MLIKTEIINKYIRIYMQTQISVVKSDNDTQIVIGYYRSILYVGILYYSMDKLCIRIILYTINKVYIEKIICCFIYARYVKNFIDRKILTLPWVNKFLCLAAYYIFHIIIYYIHILIKKKFCLYSLLVYINIQNKYNKLPIANVSQ